MMYLIYHLFHNCKEISIHKNDVSHLSFNMIVKKGFWANNEGILCMKIYITKWIDARQLPKFVC